MIKYFLTTVIFLVNLSLSSAQSNKIPELIQEGIQLHDNGDYDGAIQKYFQALQLDPESPLVNYEIAFSYYQKKEIEKAKQYLNKALVKDSDSYLSAAVLYGSILDDTGNAKKAIKFYKKALKRYPDNYLLNYNIALTYYNGKEYQKAEEYLITAITDNVMHTSSHLMLGYIKNSQGIRTKSLLPLYFFLLLEPNTDRSGDAYQLLISQQNQGVERTSDKNINVSIPFNKKLEDDFSAAETMISMVASSKYLEENKDKTEMELFSESNDSFFKILGELKKENTGFWWDLYVPFFYELALAGYTETYSNYISQNQETSAREWLENNEDKLDTFFSWLEED